ncbi:HAD ATPase, P-type, family IC [Edhazardia aedis USNM 41457]|uniref:HAD ATPase, P-type, family IC n=1 Tax=Edhazardia aedis (strain USNM 41457) TaxID=1003232 RepID=J9DF24_EDHAE|nr:HAD ATPase, P-type, family IC [Edhazardia aedis USNM 41457]|eukprot:EJW01195.1 HAD ATPase, P-type, family IC [Edhazardia aedis USNM 41457]
MSIQAYFRDKVLNIFNKPRKELTSRIIEIGVSKKHSPNVIKNQRYSTFSFVPMVLMNQFKFFFNIYFFLICLSQLFEVYSVSPLVSNVFPWVIVLALTLLKEGLDDFKRYKKDCEYNSQMYIVVERCKVSNKKSIKAANKNNKEAINFKERSVCESKKSRKTIDYNINVYENENNYELIRTGNSNHNEQRFSELYDPSNNNSKQTISEEKLLQIEDTSINKTNVPMEKFNGEHSHTVHEVTENNTPRNNDDVNYREIREGNANNSVFDDIKSSLQRLFTFNKSKKIQKNQINKVKLFDGIQTKEVPSSELNVGDVIFLHKNQRVPADCILLKSLEPNLFIRTDQLDGETDWKLRIPALQSENICEDSEFENRYTNNLNNLNCGESINSHEKTHSTFKSIKESENVQRKTNSSNNFTAYDLNEKKKITHDLKEEGDLAAKESQQKNIKQKLADSNNINKQNIADISSFENLKDLFNFEYLVTADKPHKDIHTFIGKISYRKNRISHINARINICDVSKDASKILKHSDQMEYCDFLVSNGFGDSIGDKIIENHANYNESSKNLLYNTNNSKNIFDTPNLLSTEETKDKLYTDHVAKSTIVTPQEHLHHCAKINNNQIDEKNAESDYRSDKGNFKKEASHSIYQNTHNNINYNNINDANLFLNSKKIEEKSLSLDNSDIDIINAKNDQNKIDYCDKNAQLNRVEDDGYDIEIPLSIENILWMNTVLASGHAICLVTYTGEDTRAVMNTQKPRQKTGLIDHEINTYSKLLFALSFFFSCVFTVLRGLAFRSDSTLIKFIVILSGVVPISLKVSIDWARHVYTLTMHKEITVRNSNIPEDLGRIEYLLCDKTGTLTKNEMEMKKVHLGSICFDENINEIRNIIFKRNLKYARNLKDQLAYASKENIVPYPLYDNIEDVESRFLINSVRPENAKCTNTKQLGEITHLSSDATTDQFLQTQVVNNVESCILNRNNEFSSQNYNNKLYNTDKHDKNIGSMKIENFHGLDAEITNVYKRKKHNLPNKVYDLLVGLSICHNVTPVVENNQTVYQASSPDEIAIIKWLEKVGIKLVKRTRNSITIREEFAVNENIFKEKIKNSESNNIDSLDSAGKKTILEKSEHPKKINKMISEDENNETKNNEDNLSGRMENYNSLLDEVNIDESRVGVKYSKSNVYSENIINFHENLYLSETREKKFKILHIFPFTSESKRMGIIVKNANKIEFYCKGADSVMCKMVKKNDWLKEEVSNMARDGLRTLIIAKKEILNYKKWKSLFNKACTSMEYRKENIQNVVSMLENDLTILGLTGVEDKLQENVKNTLESLRFAGMKIWMLTGDKLETAINIAISSKLFGKLGNIKVIENINSREQAFKFTDSFKNISIKNNEINKSSDNLKKSQTDLKLKNSRVKRKKKIPFLKENQKKIMESLDNHNVSQISISPSCKISRNNKYFNPNPITDISLESFVDDSGLTIDEDFKIKENSNKISFSIPKQLKNKNHNSFDHDLSNLSAFHHNSNGDSFSTDASSCYKKNHKSNLNENTSSDLIESYKVSVGEKKSSVKYSSIYELNNNASFGCHNLEAHNSSPSNSTSIEEYDVDVENSSSENQNTKDCYSYLVIDGTSLEFLMKNYKNEFIAHASQLESVVCCRCSPTQKASIALAIRELTKKRVAAIGDGGNDVSMITSADVGIGIIGKEGKQASLAADFSINRFCEINTLFLWHGRNFYKATARLTHLIVHRGTIVSVMQAIFCSLFAFSPISLFQGAIIVGYVTIYTFLPVFCSILTKDTTKEIALKYPELYKEMNLKKELSLKSFATWNIISFYQGALIMLLAFCFFENELFGIITITFSSLIINELLMVMFTVKNIDSKMAICLFMSLFFYLMSFAIPKVELVLPNNIIEFVGKVIAINIAAILITVIEKIYYAFRPSSVIKVSLK